MESMLAPILQEVDTRILIGFAVVMGILVVVTLIKKAVKLSAVVAAFAAIAIAIVPAANDFQEKYKFNIVDGAAVFSIEGTDYKIDKRTVDNIEMENTGFSGYKTVITFLGNEGEASSNITLNIPTFMVSSIRDFADKQDIKIKVRE